MTTGLRIVRSPERWDLVLARPERGNCLSQDLVAGLDGALEDAAAAGVAMVVIGAEGRHFCTGFDLSDLDDCSDADLLARFVAIEQLLARLWAAPFVTAAVAQGRVIGAGADLFVCCRLRLALPEARFQFPGPGFGLVLGTRRLGLRIGPEAAGELLRAGGELPADRAAALGLVHAILPEGAARARLAQEQTRIAALGAETCAALQDALAGPLSPGLDRDLAALVRSAARPGLRDRIIAHRNRVAAQRRAGAAPEPTTLQTGAHP